MCMHMHMHMHMCMHMCMCMWVAGPTHPTLTADSLCHLR